MSWADDGPLATYTIDRPAVRNALDLATIEAMLAGLQARRDAPGLRVVVITGAGERAFCAGADLAGLAANAEARRLAGQRYAALLATILEYPRPVVARVNGACMAGGWGLLLACDLAVAVESATFQLPEVNVGMWPMMVGAFLVPLVGRRTALELALTARKLGAAEARELGLVNRVVADLDAGTAALVGELLRASPSALRIGRAAWTAAACIGAGGSSPGQALPSLAERLGDLMETEDAAEGYSAFLEKRPPAWKDR
ncbi:MAG: crotonase [Myxococcales bacterium]|nr:crotonase [Myxococcales bacterium]